MNKDGNTCRANRHQTERTPTDRFENAILDYGIVAACEWFGHSPDSEFTAETRRVLAERVNKAKEAA